MSKSRRVWPEDPPVDEFFAVFQQDNDEWWALSPLQQRSLWYEATMRWRALACVVDTYGRNAARPVEDRLEAVLAARDEGVSRG